jgi:hypothetical protein
VDGVLLPCNGHAESCYRADPTCREDNKFCDAVCVCSPGWVGRDCGTSQAQLEEQQDVTDQLVDVLVGSPME